MAPNPTFLPESAVTVTLANDPKNSTSGLGPDHDIKFVTGRQDQEVFDKKVEVISTKVLKAAFRRWKRSRKKGAALIEVRRTRHGKPVY